jgi:acid phosphatase family membrane protein YuiD
MIRDFFNNQMLFSALTAWVIAQALKIPVEYIKTRELNWSLLFSSGGMPSSHSALVSAVALSIGLNDGFGSAAFALSIVVAMVIIYDASGIRRQAGLHAEKINVLVNEFLQGQPISQVQLREVLGHTHRQVIAGIFLGAAIALLYYFLFLLF